MKPGAWMLPEPSAYHVVSRIFGESDALALHTLVPIQRTTDEKCREYARKKGCG